MSFAMATNHLESNLFQWILPASVALHLGVAIVAPRAASRALQPASLSALVIELPPPEIPKVEEPKPEPEPEPERAPEPKVIPRVATAPASPSKSARAESARAEEAPEKHEEPADFTGTLLSGEAGSIAVRAGNAETIPMRSASAGTARPVIAPPVASAGPRVVAVRDLSRPPRAAALDEALERFYPADAKRLGVGGKAVLRIRVLPDGHVDRVQIREESYPGFGQACERTVKSAKWDPPLDRDGVSVATEISYTCRFEVRS